MNIFRCALQVTNPPNPTRGGHPSHSNLVRGKLTSPTPNPAGDGTSGLTSYPRRRSKVSEATCLRPQRSGYPRLEPGPSDPESSALTTGPPTPHLLVHVTSKTCHACTTPQAHLANSFHQLQYLRDNLFTICMSLFALLVKLLDEVYYCQTKRVGNKGGSMFCDSRRQTSLKRL